MAPDKILYSQCVHHIKIRTRTVLFTKLELGSIFKLWTWWLKKNTPCGAFGQNLVFTVRAKQSICSYVYVVCAL